MQAAASQLCAAHSASHQSTRACRHFHDHRGHSFASAGACRYYGGRLLSFAVVHAGTAVVDFLIEQKAQLTDTDDEVDSTTGKLSVEFHYFGRWVGN